MRATARKINLQEELRKYCQSKAMPIMKVTPDLSVVQTPKGQVWVASADCPTLLTLRERGFGGWIKIKTLREFSNLY